MPVAMANDVIGPITSKQARRASWLSDLNPELAQVATVSELVAGLHVAQETLNQNLWIPCTAPADDHERRARDVVRVRTANIAEFLTELGVTANSRREEVFA